MAEFLLAMGFFALAAIFMAGSIKFSKYKQKGRKTACCGGTGCGTDLTKEKCSNDHDHKHKHFEIKEL